MKAATRRQRRETLRQARAVIQARYRDPDLDLGDVADAVRVSPRQLQRVFREEGVGDFRGYLLRVRMERATRLLRRGVAGRRVAPQVGYRQASGLRQALLRYAGKNPSEFQPPPLDYDEEWKAAERRSEV